MAWKPRAGQQTRPQPTQVPAPQPAAMQKPQDSGILGNIAGSVGGLGISAASGAAKVPTNIIDLVTSMTQQQPYVTSAGEIQHGQVDPSKFLTPKVEATAQSLRKELPAPLGFPGEEFVNQVAEATPGFLGAGATGTTQSGLRLASNAIVRALGSEAGKSLVEQAGGGKLAQFFGSAVGSALAGGLLTRGNLKNVENQNYNQFKRSIPEGAQADLNKAQSAYNKALGSKKLTGDASKWLEDKLTFLEPNLKSGKADIRETFEDMLKLNKIRRLSIPSIHDKVMREDVKEVLDNIAGALKQDIVNSKEKYPDLFTQGLVTGSDISWARNHMPLISKALTLGGVGTGALTALTTGPGVAEFAGKALLGKASPWLAAAGVGAGSIADPLQLAIRSPAARQYLTQEQLPQMAAGSLASLFNR